MMEAPFAVTYTKDLFTMITPDVYKEKVDNSQHHVELTHTIIVCAEPLDDTQKSDLPTLLDASILVEGPEPSYYYFDGKAWQSMSDKQKHPFVTNYSFSAEHVGWSRLRHRPVWDGRSPLDCLVLLQAELPEGSGSDENSNDAVDDKEAEVKEDDEKTEDGDSDPDADGETDPAPGSPEDKSMAESDSSRKHGTDLEGDKDVKKAEEDMELEDRMQEALEAWQQVFPIAHPPPPAPQAPVLDDWAHREDTVEGLIKECVAHISNADVNGLRKALDLVVEYVHDIVVQQDIATAMRLFKASPQEHTLTPGQLFALLHNLLVVFGRTPGEASLVPSPNELETIVWPNHGNLKTVLTPECSHCRPNECKGAAITINMAKQPNALADKPPFPVAQLHGVLYDDVEKHALARAFLTKGTPVIFHGSAVTPEFPVRRDVLEGLVGCASDTFQMLGTLAPRLLPDSY
jgi:hypothetical protein